VSGSCSFAGRRSSNVAMVLRFRPVIGHRDGVDPPSCLRSCKRFQRSIEGRERGELTTRTRSHRIDVIDYTAGGGPAAANASIEPRAHRAKGGSRMTLRKRLPGHGGLRRPRRPSLASAADIEVIHWWTSKGRAAAVAQFAKAL
jgi:hypothetical protein